MALRDATAILSDDGINVEPEASMRTISRIGLLASRTTHRSCRWTSRGLRRRTSLRARGNRPRRLRLSMRPLVVFARRVTQRCALVIIALRRTGDLRDSLGRERFRPPLKENRRAELQKYCG